MLSFTVDGLPSRSLPPEILYNIVAPVIMEAINVVVLSDNKEFCDSWRTHMMPLLLASKHLHQTTLRVFSHALDIKRHRDGRCDFRLIDIYGADQVLCRLKQDPMTVLYNYQSTIPTRRTGALAPSYSSNTGGPYASSKMSLGETT